MHIAFERVRCKTSPAAAGQPVFSEMSVYLSGLP